MASDNIIAGANIEKLACRQLAVPAIRSTVEPGYEWQQSLS
jgi:hypothetical protein